jgi:hypothetical protein
MELECHWVGAMNLNLHQILKSEITPAMTASKLQNYKEKTQKLNYLFNDRMLSGENQVDPTSKVEAFKVETKFDRKFESVSLSLSRRDKITIVFTGRPVEVIYPTRDGLVKGRCDDGWPDDGQRNGSALFLQQVFRQALGVGVRVGHLADQPANCYEN